MDAMSFGEKILIARKRSKMSRPSLSTLSDVSERTIARVESGDRVKLITLKSIRDALKLNVTDDELTEIAIPVAVDENVATFTEQNADIPRFDLCVAAGHWTDAPENNEDAGQRVTEAQWKRKLFEVHIRGDSMDGGKNPIKDGAIIRFKLLFDGDGLPDCSLVESGKSYYVQLSDGRATFKRAVDCGHGKLILAANNRKYRKQLECDLELIQRLAVATAEVREF